MLTRHSLFALICGAADVIASPVRRYANSTTGIASISLAGGYDDATKSSATFSTTSFEFANQITTLPGSGSTETLVAEASPTLFSYAPFNASGTSSSNPIVSSTLTGHSQGTTTLTLFTTVSYSSAVSSNPPINSANAFNGSSAILNQTSVAIETQRNFTTSPTSIIAPMTAIPSSSLTLRSMSGSSSVLVYGSITLTSSVSSNTDSVPITLVPSARLSNVQSSTLTSPTVSETSRTSALLGEGSATSQASKTTSSVTGTSSQAASPSSVAPYPYPESAATMTQSSSSAQTPSSHPTDSPIGNPASATITSSAQQTTLRPNPQFSDPGQRPTSHTFHSLPSIVTQGAPSPTTSSEIPGITIIPVNPNAVTVTITTTKTDPGVTTTVAATTVTVGV